MSEELPRALGWRLTLLVVLSLPFAAGGVRPWSVPLLAIAAASALLSMARTQWRTLALPMLLAPLAVAAVWQTLLVAPLPTTFAAVGSPHYHATRTFVWQALDAASQPTWAPLATNPAVTALDAARLWAALLLGIVVFDRSRRGLPTVGLWLAVVAAALGNVCVGLWQVITQGVTGDRLPSVLAGAFINPNHQAAFYNVGWLGACVLAVRLRPRALRVLALAAAGVLLTAGALCTSRAGMAAAALGGVVLGVRLRKHWWHRRGALAVVAAAALLVGGSLFADRLAARMRFRSEEKPRVWASALHSALAYPVGTGRGGFALVFNGVRALDHERGRWDYVENEYIQAAIDYGPAGGALALLALIWLIVVSLRGSAASAERAGVGAILCTLAAHAVFDFNWEMAGVFLPVWLLIATTGRPSAQQFVPLPWHARTFCATLLAGAALVALPALTTYGLLNDPLRLEVRATRSTGEDGQAALQSLVATRPLDSWALVVLGEGARVRGDPAAALRWLSRAVTVDHDWGEPHLALARLFCQTGRRAQGRTELALAEARSGVPGSDGRLFALLAHCSDTPGDALDIAPAFAPRTVVALVRDLTERGRDDDVRAVALRYLFEAEAPSGEALAAFARFARLRNDEALWQRLIAAWPEADAGGLQRERAEHALLSRPGQTEAERSAALAAYAALAARADAGSEVHDRYVSLLLGAHRFDDAAAANAALARDCATEVSACRAYHLNRAHIAVGAGSPSQALVDYRLWLARAPGDIAAARDASALAERLEEPAIAVEILKTALRVNDDTTARAQLEALETRKRQHDDALQRRLRSIEK